MNTSNKLLFLIGFAVALAAVSIAAFMLSRSSTEVKTIFGRIPGPEITSVTRPQSKILSIDFKSSDEIPKVATVYEVSKRGMSRQEAAKIAAKFGLKTKPAGKKILTWNEKKKILEFNLIAAELDFKNQNIKPLNGGFSVKNLAAIAKKFLKQKGLSTEGLIADTNNTRLFEVTGTTLQTTSKPTKPVFIEIGFNRKLNKYSLFYANPTDPAVSVMLNNKGQVFRVLYRFINLADSKTGVYPTTDIKKLATSNLSVFGILVRPQEGDEIFDASLIKSITFEDFSLAYLDDQSGPYIQPVYILRGFARAGTEIVDVVVYYPAVAEEWLK